MGVLHNKYVINYFENRHFEHPLRPGQMCMCWIFFIMLNETPLSLKNEALVSGPVTYLAQVAKWVNLLPIQAPFEPLKRPY